MQHAGDVFVWLLAYLFRQSGGQLCGVEGPRGLSALLSVLFISLCCLYTAGWCADQGRAECVSEAAVGVLIILGLSVNESSEEKTAPRLGYTGGPLRQAAVWKAGFSENGGEQWGEARRQARGQAARSLALLLAS